MRVNFDSIIWIFLFVVSTVIYFFKTQGITITFFSFIITYLSTVIYVYVVFDIFLLLIFLLILHFAKNEKNTINEFKDKINFDEVSEYLINKNNNNDLFKKEHLDKFHLFIFLVLIILFEVNHYFYNFYLPYDIYLPFILLLVVSIFSIKIKEFIKNTFLR